MTTIVTNRASLEAVRQGVNALANNFANAGLASVQLSGDALNALTANSEGIALAIKEGVRTCVYATLKGEAYIQGLLDVQENESPKAFFDRSKKEARKRFSFEEEEEKSVIITD